MLNNRAIVCIVKLPSSQRGHSCIRVFPELQGHFTRNISLNQRDKIRIFFNVYGRDILGQCVDRRGRAKFLFSYAN